MGLIDRLAGINFPDPENPNRISTIAFWALLYELAKGKVTKAAMVNYLGLDASEEAELDWIIGRYNAQGTAAAKASFVENMFAILVLAESRVSGYSTNADLVARISAI